VSVAKHPQVLLQQVLLLQQLLLLAAVAMGLGWGMVLGGWGCGSTSSTSAHACWQHHHRQQQQQLMELVGVIQLQSLPPTPLQLSPPQLLLVRVQLGRRVMQMLPGTVPLLLLMCWWDSSAAAAAVKVKGVVEVGSGSTRGGGC
jgi:hypothetical protein